MPSKPANINHSHFTTFKELIKFHFIDGVRSPGHAIKTHLGDVLGQYSFGRNNAKRPEQWHALFSYLRANFYSSLREDLRQYSVVERIVNNVWTNSDTVTRIDEAFLIYYWLHINADYEIIARKVDADVIGAPFADLFGESFPLGAEEAIDLYKRACSSRNLDKPRTRCADQQGCDTINPEDRDLIGTYKSCYVDALTPPSYDKMTNSSESGVQTQDMSWKSPLNQWAYERLENRPANGLLASLSIERTQGGDTREPVALLAEVHIRPTYEHESGIELQFKSVDIVLKCAEGGPSEIIYSSLQDEIAASCRHGFRVQGTGSSPYVTLYDNEAGLDGTYVSETLGTFHPNSGTSELSAALLVRILTTNAIFPEDIPSTMKRQIIKRIAEKATLPAPDKAGHILLHTLTYGIRAIER